MYIQSKVTTFVQIKTTFSHAWMICQRKERQTSRKTSFFCVASIYIDLLDQRRIWNMKMRCTLHVFTIPMASRVILSGIRWDFINCSNFSSIQKSLGIRRLQKRNWQAPYKNKFDYRNLLEIDYFFVLVVFLLIKILSIVMLWLEILWA